MSDGEKTDWCAYDADDPDNAMHNLTRAEAEAFAKENLIQEWIASTAANYINVMAWDFP